MVKDNEGHGFANEENRFDFYRTMEVFLGEHIGSRIENRISANSEADGVTTFGNDFKTDTMRWDSERGPRSTNA